MRTNAQHSIATLLLLVPVLAVPLLAIFGIPELIPKRPPTAFGADSSAEWDPSEFEEAPAASDSDKSLDAIAGDAPGWGAESEVPPNTDGPVRTNPPAVREGGPDPDPSSGVRPPESPGKGDKSSPFDEWTEVGPSGPPPKKLPDEPAAPNLKGFRMDADPLSDITPVSPPVAPPVEPAAPATDEGLSSTPDPMPPVAPRTKSNITWPEAVRRLNELEIRSYRIEPGLQPAQFVFICSYTPANNPRVSYRFEAEAQEPLKAVEKVLAQIEEWRAKQ